MKLLNVILIFLIESLLQIIYYSIRIKYFEKFQSFNDFYDVFRDTLYVVGSTKAIFFLPIYIVYYLLIVKRLNKAFVIAFIHASIFFITFFILSLLLPGELLKRVVDTIFLTVITFVVAYIYIKYSSFKENYSLRNIIRI